MPVTQNIGNGVQTLDVGGIIQNASELSRLTLLKQQIDAERALAPLKYQEAVTSVQKNQAETDKFKADTTKTNFDAAYSALKLQNAPQEMSIDLADKFSKAVLSAQAAAQNGDPSGLAGVARIQSQNPYATVVPIRTPGIPGAIYKHVDSRTGQPLVDAMTGQPIPDYDPFSKEKSDPNVLSQIAERQNAMNVANAKLGLEQKQHIDNVAIEVSKSLFDPSSRSQIGQLQSKAIAADRLLALASQGGIAVPPNFENLKPNDPQRIALINQWNNLNPQYVNEIGTTLAGLLQTGVPTEGGIERQLPDNFKLSMTGIAQKLTSHPKAAEQGEFIANYMATALRERSLAHAQVMQAGIGAAGSSFIALRGTPYGQQQLDGILNGIANYNSVYGGDPKTWKTPDTYKYSLDPNPDRFSAPPRDNPTPLPNSTGTQGQAPGPATPAPPNYKQLINKGLWDNE